MLKGEKAKAEELQLYYQGKADEWKTKFTSLEKEFKLFKLDHENEIEKLKTDLNLANQNV